MAIAPLHLTDEDITTEWRDRSGAVVATSTGPTEADDDRDQGGSGDADTGDEPTEAEENLDQGGEGDADTGDEA